MAVNDEELRLIISTVYDQKGLKLAEKDFKAIKDRVKEVETQSKNAQPAVSNIFKGVVQAQLFQQVLGKTVNFLKSSVQESLEAAESQRKLEAAIGKSSLAGTGLADRLKTFNDELERTQNADADAIASLQSLAVASGRTEEEIKKITQSALDLSSATGVDVDTAFKQLNNSFSGSAGALGKLNPLFKDLTEEQLKSGAALDLVSKKFGGDAFAATQTLGGSLKSLGLIFNQFKEQVGNVVNTVLGPFVIGLKAVIGVFLKLPGAIKGVLGGIAAITVGILAMNSAFIASIAVNPFAQIGLAITVLITVIGLLIKNLDKIKLKFQEISIAVLEFIANTKALQTVLEILTLGKFDNSGIEDAIAKRKLEADELRNNINLQKETKDKQTAINEEQKKGTGDSKADEEAEKILKSKQDLAEKEKEIEEEKRNRDESFREEQLALDEEDNISKVDAEIESLEAKKQLELQNFADTQTERLAIENDFASQRLALEKNRTQLSLALDAKRKQNLESTLNTIVSLSQSKNKELAAIGKAVAIYQATIDGIAGVQKALGSAPPPFNFVLAALVGAAAAANVNQIAGTSLPLATGGVTSGATNALIGEAGQEAVIPLDSSTGINALAEALKLAQEKVTTNNNNQVTINIQENIATEVDAKIVREKLMAELNSVLPR